MSESLDLGFTSGFSPKKRNATARHATQNNEKKKKKIAIPKKTMTIRELPAFDEFPRRFTRDKNRKSTIKMNEIQMQRRAPPLGKINFSEIKFNKKVALITKDGDEFPLPPYERDYDCPSDLQFDLSALDEEAIMLTGLSVKLDLHRQLAKRSVFVMAKTIMNIIFAGLSKKKAAFNVGVYSVFLSVTFLCLLKAVADVAPVAFLKLTQDQVSVFDFQLISDYSELLFDGDQDHYKGDPFEYEPV